VPRWPSGSLSVAQQSVAKREQCGQGLLMKVGNPRLAEITWLSAIEQDTQQYCVMVDGEYVYVDGWL
jgi:hypothetical protein